MKLFTKKTLAIVLAVLLAIGSFSLFAFAVEEGEASTQTKWFAEDGTTAITKAAPGDTVIAKLYLTTDFHAGSIALLLEYNSDMLELDVSKNPDIGQGFNANPEVSGMKAYFKAFGTGKYYYRTQEYMTMPYSEATGAIAVFYFKVKDNAPVTSIGTIKVDMNSIVNDDGDGETDIAKVKDADTGTSYNQGQVANHVFTLPDYDLTLDTQSEELTLDGEIIFDAGEGQFDDGTNTATVQDYYNSALENSDEPADPTPPSGKDFVGWSAANLEVSEKDNIKYYHGDINANIDNLQDPVVFSDPATTLYAIYKDADTTYTVNVWKPVLEGKDLKKNDQGLVYYEKDTDLSKTDVGGTVGDEVVAADEVTVPDGYVLASANPETKTLVQDSAQNGIDVYLDLVSNPLTWSVNEATGKVEVDKEDTVYVGTDLSLFEDPTYDGTTDPSSDFYGYTVNWADHSNVTMPNAPYEIIGTKGDPVDVILVCEPGSATDPVSGSTVSGSFTGSDGTKTYKYGDAVTDTPTYVPPTNFKVTGWTYTDASGATQTVDSLATLPQLLKDNYTFTSDATTDALKVTVTPVLEAATDGTVTFSANGGKFADTTSSKDVAGQTYGSAIIGPGEDPTKDDVTFKGWSTDPNADPADAKKVADLGNYSAPVTYYAIYEDSRITVEWKYTDGTVIKTIKGEPTITGLDSKYPSTSTVLDFIGEPDKTNYATGYEIKWDKDITEADVDTVITGTFEKITCNVVFVDEAGNILKVITGQYGDDVTGTAPEVPEKENCEGSWDNDLPTTFEAWTDTISGTYEGEEKTFENALVIRPVYEDIGKIKVTYKHAVDNDEVLEDFAGEPLTAPAIKETDKKKGYNVAWEQDLTVFPDADTTVNLKYTPITVTVRTDPANGGSKDDEPDVAYNSTATKPADPTKDGADFLGWFLPDGSEFDFSKTIEENLEGKDIDPAALIDGVLPITAKYGVKDTYYNVTGVNDDGTFKYTATDTFTTEEPDTATYTVPSDPTLEGFTFKGWATTANATASDVTPDGKFGTESREFYPVFEINKYKVTYVLDDGSEYQVYPDIAYGAEVPKPADPTKEGYIFSGWTPAVPATMPNNALTFTAQFTQEPVESDEYTVTYYNEDTVHAAYVIKEGDPVIVPEDPERFGYIFDGWEPEVPATMPGENLTFVAKWKLDPTWIVLGIGGAAVAGGIIGASCATNAALITGAAVVGTVAVIAIAKNTHKVTYLVDGEVYKVYYILKGLKVIVPKDPAKEGYDFEGWTPDIPERMPDHDLTFEAQFSNGDAPAPVDDIVPDTGSAAAGLAAFAVISSATAAAYVMSRKKKEF